jgi:prefoldin subunit 5
MSSGKANANLKAMAEPAAAQPAPQIKDYAFSVHGWAIKMPDGIDYEKPTTLNANKPSTIPWRVALQTMQLKGEEPYRSSLDLTHQELEQPTEGEPGMTRYMLVGFTLPGLKEEHLKRHEEQRKQKPVGTELNPDGIIEYAELPIMVVTPIHNVEAGVTHLYALLQPSGGLCTPYKTAQRECFYLPQFRDSTTDLKGRGPSWYEGTLIRPLHLPSWLTFVNRNQRVQSMRSRGSVQPPLAARSKSTIGGTRDVDAEGNPRPFGTNSDGRASSATADAFPATSNSNAAGDGGVGQSFSANEVDGVDLDSPGRTIDSVQALSNEQYGNDPDVVRLAKMVDVEVEEVNKEVDALKAQVKKHERRIEGLECQVKELKREVGGVDSLRAQNNELEKQVVQVQAQNKELERQFKGVKEQVGEVKALKAHNKELERLIQELRGRDEEERKKRPKELERHVNDIVRKRLESFFQKGMPGLTEPLGTTTTTPIAPLMSPTPIVTPQTVLPTAAQHAPTIKDRKRPRLSETFTESPFPKRAATDCSTPQSPTGQQPKTMLRTERSVLDGFAFRRSRKTPGETAMEDK